MACILLVDDEEPVRSLLQRLLEREGHTVVVAADGEAGLARYAAVSPALVITDLVMPRMNGLETIRKLLKSDPDARIIAISGGSNHGDEAMLTSARALGATETLAKPFSREEFLKAVNKVLDSA